MNKKSEKQIALEMAADAANDQIEAERDALLDRVAELEAREQRIRDSAFHPAFNSMEALATIKTILTLG